MTRVEARKILADGLRRGVLVKHVRWGPWVPAEQWFNAQGLEFDFTLEQRETLELMRGELLT